MYERTVSLHTNDTIRSRKKRHVVYRPVYAKCACIENKCVPQRNPLEVIFFVLKTNRYFRLTTPFASATKKPERYLVLTL